MHLASYNIRYSLGQDGRYDMARCLSAVRGADVICLQEVERNWLRSGMVDQPVLIQELMPDRCTAYGSPFDVDASRHDELSRLISRRRQFGQMTLSRWPIVVARVSTPRRSARTINRSGSNCAVEPPRPRPHSLPAFLPLPVARLLRHNPAPCRLTSLGFRRGRAPYERRPHPSGSAGGAFPRNPRALSYNPIHPRGDITE